ncbi:DUF5316 family protein [Paenibacillus pasadenensis]|uniref:DUF5316 domain-containing protein n=1 Tax=Paenibacillus pasadenensis TaxID=217090 RepID=A0A2N5N0Z3_9BACL|nr:MULTISPECIES: DUF5316 family protein [Paenibacillus]PLT44007.1 hypothetical protein B8V81_2438 [Paenibacillus pasadenensis]QGG54566.1 hypothetical protein GE073_02395 [Paenibacillus sp. B01]
MTRITLVFLSAGLGLAAVAGAVGLVAGQDSLVRISAWSGGIPLLLAMLFSGAFIQADSRRIGTYTDDGESLRRRNDWSARCLLLAVPSLLLCAGAYFL